MTENCDVRTEAPEHALTITLNTFLTARRIVLMALGHGKAEAVERLIYGVSEPENFTAHYLELARDRVTVLLDEGAAARL